MKVLPLLIAAILASTTALPSLRAQDGELQENYEKKLAEPFLTKAPWLTDYDKAREESKKSGKPIFAYFTRSYAY